MPKAKGLQSGGSSAPSTTDNIPITRGEGALSILAIPRVAGPKISAPPPSQRISDQSGNRSQVQPLPPQSQVSTQAEQQPQPRTNIRSQIQAGSSSAQEPLSSMHPLDAPCLPPAYSSQSPPSTHAQHVVPEQQQQGYLLPAGLREACEAAFSVVGSSSSAGASSEAAQKAVVARAQPLLVRCLHAYLSPDETAAVLKNQANFPPVATQAALSALEACDPAFFQGYRMRLRLKEQVEAFNVLVAQTAQQTLVTTQTKRRMGDGDPSDAPARSIPRLVRDSSS